MEMDTLDEGRNDASYVEMVKGAIAAWRAETPGVIAQALGVALTPVNWLVHQIIPQSAIEGVLGGFDWIAKKILTDAFARDLGDIRQCDKGADRVINFHIAAAAGEGALAGFFGIFALPLDIPAIITLALRVVRQVGVEYGYSDDTEDERKFVFSALSAAGANSQEEKVAALGVASFLMNKLAKETWKTMAARAAANQLGADAAVIAIRNLAKQLGYNLTKRKALTAIPAIIYLT